MKSSKPGTPAQSGRVILCAGLASLSRKKKRKPRLMPAVLNAEAFLVRHGRFLNATETCFAAAAERRWWSRWIRHAATAGIGII